MQACLDADERGERCDQIQVLPELCGSSGLFAVEACSDQRVREMLSR